MPDAKKPVPHPDLSFLQCGLPRLRDALLRQRKIRIVAIGSSSTAGEGVVIPFPHRLELLLRNQYPGRMIDVVNRGIGGQEAPEEFARFEGDVGAEAPVLVIWQVGTNAIFHRDAYDLRAVAANIEAGLAWLKALPADVILMDMQYAPAMFWNNNDHSPNPAKAQDTYNLVAAIAAIAAKAEVNLFRRFALMERWVTVDKVDQNALIKPDDGLHQTELATDWVTQILADAMVTAIGPVPGSPMPVV